MLKEFIEGSGLPRSAWAERLGISRSYLYFLENGHKSPSLALAVRIERETGGAVPATSWVPEEGAGDVSGEAA